MSDLGFVESFQQAQNLAIGIPVHLLYSPFDNSFLKVLKRGSLFFARVTSSAPSEAQNLIPAWRLLVEFCILDASPLTLKDLGHGLSSVLVLGHRDHAFPSSIARRVASCTASISAARTPPFSSACSPAMVV